MNNIKNENNFLLNISNWIINSKSFFNISIILMSSLALLQIILFVTNNTIINGVHFKEIDSISKWAQIIIWLRLFLGGIGGVTATLGLILINRGNRKFYYFSITTAILLTINGFLSSLFFEGIKWFIVGIILLINAIIWNIPAIKINVKRIKYWKLILIIVSVILITFLIGKFGVSKIPSDSLFYNSMPILDPMQSGITMTGNFMMIFKIVESRIIYGIGNIFTIVMFSSKTIHGDLVSLNQVFQGVLYLIVTIAGFIKLKEESKK